MLALRPLPCTFTQIPVDYVREAELYRSNKLGSYHIELPFKRDLRNKADPISQARFWYSRFNLLRPDRNLAWFARGYLVFKVFLLRREWERRHAFFIVYGEGVESDSIECGELCPLKLVPGKHAKTEAETAWEQSAADAYNHFAAQLNQLVTLETHGREITGYSSEDATDFGPDKVPLSLFDLPNVPGPDTPPGDRVDLFLDFDKRNSELAPGGSAIRALLSRYTNHDHVKVTILSAVQGLGSSLLGWFSSNSAKASERRVAFLDAKEQEQDQTKTKGD